MAAKNGLKALVVDDEPDIVELLQYNLNKEGFEVRTAENGKKALEIARPATAGEQAAAARYLRDLRAVPGATPAQTWADFAQSVLNLKEFLYVK